MVRGGRGIRSVKGGALVRSGFFVVNVLVEEEDAVEEATKKSVAEVLWLLLLLSDLAELCLEWPTVELRLTT